MFLLLGKMINTRGGGGGVLRFGSDGGVPLKPPNQYLSLRVILAEKGTYGFLVKKMMFLCTLAMKWATITKVGGMFRDFSQKSDLLERHTPVLPYTASTPPPPPPRG